MWRAYVRAQSLGHAGTPSFIELGAAYRKDVAEDDPKMPGLAAIGRAATRAGKLLRPKAGDSSFGPTSRHVKRRKLREFRQALCLPAATCSAEQQAINLGERLVDLGADTKTCLSIARSALRIHSERRKIVDEEIDTAFRRFEEGEGAQQVAEVQKELPGLQGASLMPVPWPGGRLFELAIDHPRMSAGAAAWAVSSRETELSTSLRQHWEQAHKTLMEDSAVVVDAADSVPSSCRIVGRCLCSAAGRSLKRFRDMFLQCMKAVFPQGSDLRRRLMDGSIVVRLQGQPLDDDEDAFLAEDDPFKESWLHIGLQYLSPYRPTFAQLVLNPDMGGEAMVGGALRLKVLARGPIS